MSAAVEWLVLPYDNRPHVFNDPTAETARAVCGLAAAPGEVLTAPTADSVKCLICQVTCGRETAELHGRAADWGAVWSPFDEVGPPPAS